MSRSKKKPNNLNKDGIQEIAGQIVSSWPWTSVTKAFYVADPDPLNISDSSAFTNNVVSASVEIRDQQTDVRIYRKADEGIHAYDVDEIRAVNAPVVIYPSKPEIENHHLSGTIEEDLMRRNNLSVEVVPDGKGGMKVNVQPDGTVKAFINFERSPEPKAKT